MPLAPVVFTAMSAQDNSQSFDSKMEDELERALAANSDGKESPSDGANCDNNNAAPEVASGVKAKPRTSPPHTYENDDVVRKFKEKQPESLDGGQQEDDGCNMPAGQKDASDGPQVKNDVLVENKAQGNGKHGENKSTDGVLDSPSKHTYENEDIAKQLKDRKPSRDDNTTQQVSHDDKTELEDSNIYDDTAIILSDGRSSDISNLETKCNTEGSGGDTNSKPDASSQKQEVTSTGQAQEPDTVYDDVADPLLASAGSTVISADRSSPEELFYDDPFIPVEETNNSGSIVSKPIPAPRQTRIDRTSSEMDDIYDEIGDDQTDTQEPPGNEKDWQTSSAVSSGGYDHLWKSKPKSEGDYGSTSSAVITPNTPVVEDDPVYFDYDDSPHSKSAACGTLVQSYEEEAIYEPIGDRGTTSDSDESWGSDEFETYDDCDPNVERKSVGEHVQNTPFLIRLGNTFRASKREASPEEDSVYKDVDLSTVKHPPPALPPMPDGLTAKQIKRRLIISSIVSSEQSYLESVTRLVKEYEQPLIENPSILSRDKIKTIFHKLRDIRQVHLQFQIALKVTIDAWDENEEIADVFIASFGKTIVFDVYSGFVNNFSQAMETVKLVSRTKQPFADFLKQKIMSSADKLSIFGLMVKPVQRFPQYILQLQDLLKYTPEDHKDRLKLQMALTELENLAHRLNENKRESERKYAIKAILNNLKLSQKAEEDISRSLIRQDNMLQVEYNSHGEMVKSKQRRMIILSDLLICTTVMHRESSVDLPTSATEKYSVKWRVPIQDVEYVETAVTPHMQVNIHGAPGRTTLTSKEVMQEEPIHLHREVSNMLHDRAVLAEISGLASSLRLAHKNFSADLVDTILKDLQKTIHTKNEQLRVLESSTIQLIIPANETSKKSHKIEQTGYGQHKKYSVSRSGSVRYFFRTATTALKRDWVLDFQAAKLALDMKNRPAWVFPESSGSETSAVSEVPLFFKPLPIDVTRLYTKISCGLPMYVQSSQGSDLELQHLWVCSSLPDRGQVTVLSMCSNKPHLLQSFQACDEAIICVELVPGMTTGCAAEGFAEDTVWMGTTGKRIVVHSMPNQDPQEKTNRPVPKLVLTTPSIPTRLKFACNRLVVAMENGSVSIYSRAKDGSWKVTESRLFSLGSTPVTCLLPIGEEVFAGCGNVVYVITLTNSEYKVTSHVLDSTIPIQDMVKAGVGLWIALQGKPTLKLYHLETFEGLQVMDIDRAVARALASKEKAINATDYSKNVNITCLLVTRGLLWIGTNIGITLTIPLPRLEGVPRIHSSPTVACHAHNGPVKFLVPICCGLGVPHIIDRPANMNTELSPPGVVSESKSPTQRLTMSLDVESSRSPPRDPPPRPPVRSNSLDLQEVAPDVMEHEYDDPGTLQKAQSTPNLLDAEYGGEYINLLYGSLMRKHSEVEFESSLNDRGDYMTVQATKADVVQYRKTTSMSRAKGYLRSFRAKSVPVINEKDETEESAYEAYSRQHFGHSATLRKANHDQTTGTLTKASSLDAHSSRESMVNDENSKPVSTHGPLCRSVTVICGGEGYCNWNKIKPKDLKNSESCLLLWQCTFPSSLSAV